MRKMACAEGKGQGGPSPGRHAGRRQAARAPVGCIGMRATGKGGGRIRTVSARGPDDPADAQVRRAVPSRGVIDAPSWPAAVVNRSSTSTAPGFALGAGCTVRTPRVSGNASHTKVRSDGCRPNAAAPVSSCSSRSVRCIAFLLLPPPSPCSASRGAVINAAGINMRNLSSAADQTEPRHRIGGTG